MSPKRVGDLEIPQDLTWQRKAWRIHRIGWGALALFVIAAAIGLFGGDGPLREAEVDGIQYDRFTRFGSPTEMNLLPPSADEVEEGEIEVRVAADYLSDFTVTSVTPQPDSVRSTTENVIYTFVAGKPPGPIGFSLVPRESGVQQGSVRIGDGATVEFEQIVYP